MKGILIAIGVAFMLGFAAGIAVISHMDKSEAVEVAQARTSAVKVDAVSAVDAAQKADTSLIEKKDEIQTQTREAKKEVKRYATRPSQPVRSTEPANAPDNETQQHDVQPTSACRADDRLSIGTVSVLNAHRAGVPLDRAALPGDAEGKAPSDVEVEDLVDADIEVAGMYRELAQGHDALVDYVRELQRKQQQAALTR